MSISLHFNNKERKVKPGFSLFDYAEKMDIRVPTSCQKQGKCKECLVEVVAGMDLLSPPSDQESHLRENFRLSCRTEVIASQGVVKCHTMRRGEMQIEGQGNKITKNELEIAPCARVEEGNVLINGKKVDLYSGHIYGIALDLGTTTIVMRLVDLENGKIEATTSFENGKTTRKFYTLESRLSHWEAQLRAVFSFGEVRQAIRLAPQMGAIAFNATGGLEGNSNPQTTTHTAAGSDRLAMVYGMSGNANVDTTAGTYDSVDYWTSGNVLGGTSYVSIPTNNSRVFMYYLNAPNTTAGATVSLTLASGTYVILSCSTFSGCDQTSAVIDSSNTNTTTSGTSLAVTTTVVAKQFAHGVDNEALRSG